MGRKLTLLISVLALCALEGCGHLWGSVQFASNGNTTIGPYGTFMYVCSQNGPTYMQGFKINYSTLTFTPLDTSAATGAFCDEVQVVSLTSGLKILLEYSRVGHLQIFNIDPASGKLTPNAASPLWTGSSLVNSFAVDPTNQYIYAVDFTSGAAIDVFKINQTTGGATFVASNPYSAGTNWFRSIPILNGSNLMFQFIDTNDNLFEVMQISSIDPTSMTPRVLTLPAFCNNTQTGGMLFSGAYLFFSCTNGANSILNSYQVTPVTGVLTPITSLSGLFQNLNFALDPTGAYLFFQTLHNLEEYNVAAGVISGGTLYGTNSNNYFGPIMNPKYPVIGVDGGLLVLGSGGVLTDGPTTPGAFGQNPPQFDPTSTIWFSDNCTGTSINAYQLDALGNLTIINNGNPITTVGCSNGNAVDQGAQTGPGLVFTF